MNLLRMAALAVLGPALIFASVFVVDRTHDAQERTALQQRNDTLLRAAQAQIEGARSDELRLRATLLAADGASTAYIADALLVGATPGQAVDSASISDLLGDRREQLDLDAVGVIDVAGGWVAGTRPWSDGGTSPQRHPLFVAARDTQKLALGLVREDQRLYLAAIQPMVRAGTVDAYWYAASAIDEQFLTSLAALVPLDLALMTNTEPPQLLAQSADIDAQTWLAAGIAGDSSGAVGAPAQIATDGDQLTRLPLFGDAVRAVLLARAAPASGADGLLSPPLLLLSALWSLGWLLALYAWWRSSLQPAALACDLLERAALGDFKLRAPPWPSGLRGRFAAAFDTLMLRVGSR